MVVTNMSIANANTKNERSISQLVDVGITGTGFFEYLIIHQNVVALQNL